MDNIPEMTTLVECLQYLKKEGYTEEFDVKNGKLIDPYNNTSFEAKDIAVDNFYRFEGMSNPSDNAILYAITTSSGNKGALVDAYGTYADESTEDFFKQVSQISKKIKE